MDTSPAHAPSSRLSLLIGPWHNSSRVVAGLMLLFLVFCNVPGQNVKRVEYEIGHPFYVISQFEHGWPCTYLTRAKEVKSALGVATERTVLGCFEFFADIVVFRPWMLLANGFVVLLASLACGLAFEVWRRDRQRLWHIHLKDLLGLVLAFSLGGAWYYYAQRRHVNQERTIGDATLVWADNEEGGITWLRLWIGERALQFLDLPFSAYVGQPEGWRRLEVFSSAKHVSVRFRSTTVELAHLAELPRLEALDLTEESFDPVADEIVAELPPLSQLRGLCLSQPANRCRRLDRLSGLKALRITQGCIDDEALREVSALRNLRELSLDHLSESADLSFLPSLPKLSALDLYYGTLNGSAIQSIGRCSRLNFLRLYMCQVDGRGIRHLSELADLETLDLDYTNVTSRDLAPLAALKRLRELRLTRTKVEEDLCFASSLENLEALSLYDTKIRGDKLVSLVGLKRLRSLDLGYTSIGADGTATLCQMKQLKWLRVTIGNENERWALQMALPECEIDYH